MRIGIPREVKDGEYRVALSPTGIRGLNVVVERGAGQGVGFSDEDYRQAGAKLGDPWECELVVKVKELQESEYARPRPGQTVFGFQHFAPDPELLDAALASGATFIAYETVGQAGGRLPILAPMSAIAGRLAVQVGAWCLLKQNGGSGVLLPGLDGVAAGKVVILGAGNVGSNALAVAYGLGARVAVFAKSEKRFAGLKAKYPQAGFHAGPLGRTSRRCRSRHRRRAHARPDVAEADFTADAARDAPRIGPRGRRHRPGRDRGDFAPDFA